MRCVGEKAWIETRIRESHTPHPLDMTSRAQCSQPIKPGVRIIGTGCVLLKLYLNLSV